jgi:4-amino-4-deoxy-L-arabinose transferase-like glycosyltransferase
VPLPLVAILILAFGLRIWAVDRVPPGLDSDEVSIGYNAYSVLKTGRDEYGTWLPLAFRAFGEFKRPAYVYAAVPTIAAFGPTPLGLRLPAVLAGTASVAVFYGVARLLLGRRWQPLAAALFLAISPWHLQFTRAAREVSLLLLALLILALGLLAAAHRARRAPAAAGRFAVLGAGGQVLALDRNTSGLLIAPLLGLLLAGVYWRRLRLVPRSWLCAAAVVLLLGALPLAWQFVDGRARERISQVSLLSNRDLLELSAERIARERAAGVPATLNAPLFLAARRAVGAYVSHFDPTYLFTRGDANWRHHSTDSGQLYLWDLPLVVAGLTALVRGRRRPPLQAIGGWLLVGPVPAAFATEAPHAVRSLPMLPALYLLAVAGVPVLWRLLRARAVRVAWAALLGASVLSYLAGYYFQYPYEHAAAWSSGAIETYREAQALVEAGRYDEVVVPNYLGFAYVYGLFATGYDPASYQEQGGTAQLLAHPLSTTRLPLVYRPFVVRTVDWGAEPRSPRTLYLIWLIGGRGIPPDLRDVDRIKNAGGRDAFLLAAFSR